MRRLAEDVGMRAPSLYKHFPNKQCVEAALIDIALESMGRRLHAAVAQAGPEGPVVELLRAYRQASLEQPHLYRLATSQDLPRDLLSPGLEEWSGEPFFLATGEAHLAQALWAFAHGMAILEIEERFMGDSDLDRTWAEGAAAFGSSASVASVDTRK